VTARRGQPKEPEPLVQGQGGSTTCIPRFGEEHLTLGYSSLRNTSDSSIVGDDVRLQHGYPPRFSYREGKIACRHRRPGPGSTVAPGEVLDISCTSERRLPVALISTRAWWSTTMRTVGRTPGAITAP
jgi:hypothetical protein